MMIVTSRIIILATILCSGCLAIEMPFIQRYEPIWYDLEELIGQHHRMIRTTSGDDRSINLQFMAMGRSFDLVLIPDTTIFHKQFEFQTSDGLEINTAQLKSSTYTGYDRNTPGSRVHGNMISGVFDGTIYTDNEIYYVEPAHRYARDTAHHSIVYRHSDINKKALQGARCGVSDSSSLVEYLEKTRRSIVTPDTPVLRERRQSARNRTRVRCDISILGDYKFYDAVTKTVQGGDDIKKMVAASLLTSYVQGSSDIFRTTDFDGDPDTTDNIQLGIRQLIVETTESLAPFDDEFLGVERFLRLHSDASDTSRFCLSYRFTHRDFDGGVLGLAYVAKLGFAGGICESTLNTGIVTTLNYGQRVPPLVTTLTLAHEIGHNFGSEHDPVDDNTCSPGGNDGNYVMYAFANTGDRGNNMEFSPCSTAMMDLIIANRGQDNSEECFAAADDVCENGFLDEGEACDCGIEYDDTTGRCNEDICCNGRTCQLFGDAECSPGQGPCCAPSCVFQNPSVMCADDTACALPSNCSGSSPTCPESPARTPSGDLDYILCNSNTATCVDNMCNGSFCEVLNTSMCPCTAEDQICDVCCMIGDECISTISLAEEGGMGADLLPDGVGQYLPVGTPCNDFIGYCDALHNCFQVDNQGALDRLGDLFSAGNVNDAINFIRNKWWAVVVAAAGLLIGVFILILVIHLVLPRPEHVKARSQRRQSIRRTRQGKVTKEQDYNMKGL